MNLDTFKLNCKNRKVSPEAMKSALKEDGVIFTETGSDGMTDEIEFIEISDDYSALAQLDNRDRQVKESVVAYLMWHSGEVLNKSVHTDRQARANRIDSLGDTAINAYRTPDDIKVDSRRTLATKSIFTQS